MVVLGLGSNQGDRAHQLQRAVDMLKRFLSGIQCSPVYECKALLPTDAPPEWDIPFLNMAVVGNTPLPPRALLVEIKTIEQAIGRLERGHWGPREIDIDILAYDDRVADEAGLTIPHKELLRRNFALIPLADVAPGWVCPPHGKTARELAAKLPSTLTRTGIVIA